MSAYYNEIDPYAAEWLRNLIAAGHIALGEVDTRSIAEVQPDDLRQFTQCHFFAGIAGWSLAIRLAGWPDDRPIWTGSCPCQPFSAAGKQRGTEDERHLWPVFAGLIRECRPSVVAGEQVASALGRSWLAAVRDDLEAMGYAVGAADLCAAGVGAPHIRQRLWWVADAHGGQSWEAGTGRLQPGREHGQQPQDGGVGVLADAGCERPDGLDPLLRPEARGRIAADVPEVARGRADGVLADALHAGRAERRAGAGERQAAGSGGSVGLGDASVEGLEGRDAGEVGLQRQAAERAGAAGVVGNAEEQRCDGRRRQDQEGHGAAAVGGGYASPWADLVWLPCRDGKARPTEPGLQPLAHGVSGRVGRLRAYGNAIVPQVAAEFVSAFMECRP